jgi:hypothetical protein
MLCAEHSNQMLSPHPDSSALAELFGGPLKGTYDLRLLCAVACQGFRAAGVAWSGRSLP